MSRDGKITGGGGRMYYLKLLEITAFTWPPKALRLPHGGFRRMARHLFTHVIHHQRQRWTLYESSTEITRPLKSIVKILPLNWWDRHSHHASCYGN